MCAETDFLLGRVMNALQARTFDFDLLFRRVEQWF
jgi:hypothetical protein